jgi:hypothetical protein
MTRQFHALERSLRDGPPDESGYRAGGLDRQRPVVRRRSLVPTAYLTLVAVVALALAGVAIVGRGGPFGGIGATPTPRASASPGPSPSRVGPPASRIPVPSLSETFVSARNGFSVRYPPGWEVAVATQPWPQNIFLPTGHPAFDTLRRPGDARLEVASQPLAPGQTEADWLAAWFRPYQGAAPCGTAPADSPRVPIDGRSGYLVLSGCPMPADSTFSDPDVRYQALVIAGGRVYEIDLDGVVDRGYFDAVLATLGLDPASAVDS